MPLGDIPLWGEYGVLGLSLGLNIFVVVSLLRGILATRPQLDAIQKVADSWQQAYQDSMANQKDNALTMEELAVLTKTFSHFLESLPKLEDGE